jgi:hypothetical protein
MYADSHTQPNYDKLGLFRRLALHAVLYFLTEGCLISAATIMTKKIRRYYNYCAAHIGMDGIRIEKEPRQETNM